VPVFPDFQRLILGQPAARAVSLTWAKCRNFAANLENRNMLETEKVDVIDSLILGLNRTALWRKKMAAKYVTDPRNARAAECLAALATKATELTDEDFALLKPRCGWASESWRESISQAGRMVGFQHRIKDLPSFVKCLMDVLES
jgi:hypothetical protein